MSKLKTAFGTAILKLVGEISKYTYVEVETPFGN